MHPNATTRTRGIPVGNELRVHPHSPPASFPTGEPAVTRRPFALVSCLISDSSDDKENQDISAKPDTGEWSKEALDQAAPKKTCSRWDATPAETNGAAVAETPKRSRWDQAPAPEAAQPMAQIIMNAPGFMVKDKLNRYLTEEELDVLLPTEGYAIVPPPPGYTPLRAPIQPYSTPAPEMSGFYIQDGSNAAAAAAAAGLAPELPTEIPGVGSLAFFKAEDAAYFSKSLKEEDETQLTVEEMKERKIMRLLLKIKNGTPPVRRRPSGRSPTRLANSVLARCSTRSYPCS